MKRIFVAVDISAEARNKVSVYMESLKREFANVRAGWEKAEKLHLTLKFLGETSEAQLERLNEIVRKIASVTPVFNLQIHGTGVFPSPHKARILWLGVGDQQGILRKISGLLESECEKINFPTEKRDFKAHLTVARLREPHKSLEIAQTHLQNEFEPVDFEVSELVIYESVLQSTGSVYQKVSKQNLKKS